MKIPNQTIQPEEPKFNFAPVGTGAVVGSVIGAPLGWCMGFIGDMGLTFYENNYDIRFRSLGSRVSGSLRPAVVIGSIGGGVVGATLGLGISILHFGYRYCKTSIQNGRG